MKNLIIYDTGFGNTEKLAMAMGNAISVNDVSVSELSEIELLIIGSPTLGGRATPGLISFLESIPKNGLKGIKVAAFDTRFLEEKQGLFLRFILRTFGYAAPKIVSVLINKGGKLVAQPEGFIVKGKTGPLAEGEVERAKKWAKNLER